MLKLALIVPAVGLQADLDATLVSVLENRPAACPVIVPCPPSYQDPYQLEDEVRFVPCGSDDLASLLNAGIEATDADIVQLLLAGTTVASGWTDAAMTRFAESSELAAVAPNGLQAEKPARIHAWGVKYHRSGRRSYVGQGRKRSATKLLPIDAPTLFGGFFRREVFAEIGGFNPKFSPHWLDADLAARMQDAELACAIELESEVLIPNQATSRGFRSSVQAERLFWNHAANQGMLGALFAHVPLVAVDTLSQLPRLSSITSLLGRGLGLLQGWVLSSAPPDLRLAPAAESQQPTSIRIEDAAARRGRAYPSPTTELHRRAG